VTRPTCRYQQCGQPLPVTARKNAEFCSPRCRSAHHNEERRRRDGTDKRLDPRSGRQVGTSGEVRSISEARLRALKEPTDCQRIALALKVAGPNGLHSHTIRKRGLSGHPSMRISELEERGYEIEHTREFKGRRPGVRYVLVSEPNTVAKAA
jgi:hypothetical protein